MDKIKRFFECLIPVPICNLRCGYCYITQRDGWNEKPTPFKYTPEQIGQALTKERLGGTCYFSLCGSGETLVPKETVAIAQHLLANGHYVNITTNGTLTNRFKRILEFPPKHLERLHLSFSFHYLELAEHNKLHTFFANIKRVRESGCSYLLQINLCDEYLPHMDDIRRLCIEHTGALPQVAATRKENDLIRDIELYTEHSREEYIESARTFNSPLFDFTMKNFGVKPTEFCYAGDWSGTLNLGTGALARCYASRITQDIFKEPTKPISFVAVGSHCGSLFCMNSSHFMSLGVIPTVSAPSYASLRNRSGAGWYSERMQYFLGSRLHESNPPYTALRRATSNLYSILDASFAIKPLLGRLFRRIKSRHAGKNSSQDKERKHESSNPLSR